MIPVSYNIRSLAVRKTTTIATALGVGLVVFVLASSQMLSNGIKKTLGKTGHDDRAIVLRKGSSGEMESGIETPMINLILAAPGVKKDGNGRPIASTDLVVVLALDRADSAQISNVPMRGVSEGAFALRSSVRIVDGRPMTPGADEAIIGKRVRGQFKGLDLGQSFEIKKNRMVKVVGVFEAEGSSSESEIWGDLELVRTSFGREGIVSSVTVALESPTKLDVFKAAMESDKQLGLNAQRESDFYEKQSEGTAGLINFLGGAIVFFFSIGAIIGAMITMYAAVAHRQREVGTLRALGFSRFTILSSFLFEAVVLALVGGVLGAVASLGMTFVKFSMMNMASWSEITFSFETSPEIILTSLIVGGLMGIIGGLLPAIRAARVSPIDAMRE